MPDASDALALLHSCPNYAPTPLTMCPSIAKVQNRSALVVKDESVRMGLGSFKALAGVYAVASLLRARLGETSDAMALVSPEARDAAAEITVCCASAGNHGLSVATGADIFGTRAVVYLAETVPEAFAERWRGIGADVLRAGQV